jgi:hypothetical protein
MAGNTSISRDQILTKVLQWIDKLEMSPKSVEDPTTDFRIVLSESLFVSTQIIHPKAESKFIVLVATASFTEDIQKKLLESKFEYLDNIFWNIRQTMLEMGVDLQTNRIERIPSAWEISSKLFVEDSNVQKFYETYIKVRNAAMTVIFSYERVLNTAE